MYTEKVMDHFAHPRNMGEIKDANGVGMVGNAKCGDIMQMFLKVNDDGIIEDVGFKTFGCGAAVATSSMATELIKGKSIDEALKLTNSAVVEALEGLPPAKLHCSVLAEEAVKAAVDNYYARKEGRTDSECNCVSCGHDHEHEHEHHHDHNEDEHDHEHGHHHDHDHDEHDEHEHHHHHHAGEECDDPECECHHHHHHHADDVFSSWGKETPKKFSKEALEDMLHKLDSGDYGHILRAKGIVNGEDGWLEFDYVPEEHEVRAGHPDYTGRLCVIGAELKEDGLAELFGV